MTRDIVDLLQYLQLVPVLQGGQVQLKQGIVDFLPEDRQQPPEDRSEQEREAAPDRHIRGRLRGGGRREGGKDTLEFVEFV